MNIAFLATRIAGTDGVSLECEHWRDILTRMGHRVTFYAGQLDRPGTVIPELHFQSPEIVRIHDEVIYGKKDFKKTEGRVFALAGKIEGILRETIGNGKKPDLLVVPNVLSLPVHFPLAVAVTRLIEEFDIPTIARHHDFWWERKRFLKSDCFPFFKRWFPPKLSQISHITINSKARRELQKRTGIKSTVIWDSFDFDSKEKNMDSFAKHFRDDFGIGRDDTVFVQATRIVPRKRIEISVDLFHKLKYPSSCLVIAGYSGDEGKSYEKIIRSQVKRLGVKCLFIGDRVNARRRIVTKKINGKSKKIRVYTLWDAMKNSDVLLYPTEYEGFGNQFVEAMYFGKPLIVTPYDVYREDIKPLGFDVLEISGQNQKTEVSKIRKLLKDNKKISAMAKKNFELGRKYLSYDWVSKKLSKLI